jgi:hypothetical protein
MDSGDRCGRGWLGDCAPAFVGQRDLDTTTGVLRSINPLADGGGIETQPAAGFIFRQVPGTD